MFGKSDHFATKTDLELIGAKLQTLESEVRAAKLEFAELYDKTYHMLKRHEKRVRDAQREPPDAPVSVDPVTDRVQARRNHGIRQIGA